MFKAIAVTALAIIMTLGNAAAREIELRRRNQEAPPTAGPGEAIVVASLRSLDEEIGFHQLSFGQIDSHTDAYVLTPGRRREEPTWFNVWIDASVFGGGRASLDAPRYTALAVPAGRWALAAHMPAYDKGTLFCLGTVAFDIAEGDVLFLGDFTSAKADRGADVPGHLARAGDVERARSTAVLTDDQRAALREAAFLNGARPPCEERRIGGILMPVRPTIYSYEIEGAADLEHEPAAPQSTTPVQ